MPNWTSNVLSVTGRAATIKKFMAAVRGKDSPFDFERLLPIPKILHGICTGMKEIEGKKYDAWREMGADGGPEGITAAAKRKIAARCGGFSNWYDWSIAKWGTKWNACRGDEPELQKHLDGKTRTAVYRFETAWCPPIPVVMAASKKFPGLSFELYEESEGTDEWNRYTMKGGHHGDHEVGTCGSDVNEDEDEEVG